MKHLIRMLVCVLLLAALYVFAQAEEAEPETFTSGDYEYILLEDGTAEITKYNGKATHLLLPETLDGYVVSSLAEDAISWPSGVISVVIPKCIVNVGDNSADRIIFMPDHPVMARIDNVLFSKPDKRLISYPYDGENTSYRVPDGIKIIGNGAFSGCEKLTSVILPFSLTTIGDDAFNWCSNLKTITIPENVKTIGEKAFFDCSNLMSVNILGGLETIGNNAFNGCESLTEITLPDTLISIGEGAFRYCSRLVRINIPASVTEIGEDVFEYCYRVTVTVERGSYAEQYCIENGLYFQYPDSLDWLND